MIRKYVLSIAAAAGLVLAILTVLAGNRPVPVAPPVVPPPKAPFASYVAGAGIVEASTRNISIGTPVAGLVTEVSVQAGDEVHAGQVLFMLDDRDLVAQLAVRQASLAAEEASLRRITELPRPEDIPPAEARVTAAEMSLSDHKNQLVLWESVTDKRAVSQDALDQRRFAVEVAQAKLLEATSELALLKAGAWEPDVEIAAAAVAQTRAMVNQTQTDIDRLTIRAPVDGVVLQRNIEPGEYAAVSTRDDPLMMLGHVQDLHVRVDVDENDAWRVQPGAKAIAYLRGNPKFKADILFVRFEPFVVPKRSLTGASTERVDTRVLQVIYTLNPSSMPVYVGQLMDVLIEAPPVAGVQMTDGVQDTDSTLTGAVSR